MTSRGGLYSLLSANFPSAEGNKGGAFSEDGGTGSMFWPDGITHDGIERISMWVRSDPTSADWIHFRPGQVVETGRLGTDADIVASAWAAFGRTPTDRKTVFYWNGSQYVDMGLDLDGWSHSPSGPAFYQLVFDINVPANRYSLSVNDDVTGLLTRVNNISIDGTISRVNGIYVTSAIDGGHIDAGWDRLIFSTVPEPSTLIATNLVGLAVMRRRRG